MKMKKSIILLLAVVIMLSVTILASCASEKESAAIPSEILAKIVGVVIPEKEVVDGAIYLESGATYTSNAADDEGKLSDGQISVFYGKLDGTNDFDVVESYALWSATGNFATEIGIFKVADAKDTEKVVEFAKARVETLENNARNYDPLELEKAQNAVVETKGKYVYYVITNINDVLVDTIKAEIELKYIS